MLGFWNIYIELFRGFRDVCFYIDCHALQRRRKKSFLMCMYSFCFYVLLNSVIWRYIYIKKAFAVHNWQPDFTGFFMLLYFILLLSFWLAWFFIFLCNDHWHWCTPGLALLQALNGLFLGAVSMKSFKLHMVITFSGRFSCTFQL